MKYLTNAEMAESAFNARVKELGLTINDDVAVEAFQNAFAVEVYLEYRNDAERWEAALATLNMLADQRGLER